MNTNTEFASAGYTAGQLNALIKMIRAQAGEDGVERFLRGEVTISLPPRTWTEQDGVIRFSVTSDGTTGKQWIGRLQNKNYRVGDYAKSILLSPDFKPTSEITTEIVVLGGKLFTDKDRVTKKIRAYAESLTFENRKPVTPNAEIACLIREKFTDKDLEEMGLYWIVAMHDPIKDSVGDPRLLDADRLDDGGWLSALWDGPDGRWSGSGGFAFALPQVSSFFSRFREFLFVSPIS
jgi:hypothetical protein